jgi:leader peptidase (prepilin peptidase) / N-methyltransferase
LTSTDLVLVVLGTFGFLALGSFTCVVIDRLPLHLDEPDEFGSEWDTRPWREVLGGHSRCSSCGDAVRPYDNVPVVSWLLLRGRCRRCGERIPGYHPLVELVCPLLFLGAVWALGADWRLLPALWLIPVGVAVSVIDLRIQIVPTRIVWPAFLVSIVCCAVAAGLEGEWGWLLSAAIGLAVLAGPLFAIWFVHPAGMGFGDVRLAVLLGWNVGFFAGVRPLAAVFLALCCMVVAAVTGLVLGIVGLGLRGRKAQVPFGPAMVIAAFLCIGLAPQILDPFAVYSLG